MIECARFPCEFCDAEGCDRCNQTGAGRSVDTPEDEIAAKRAWVVLHDKARANSGPLLAFLVGSHPWAGV